MYSIVPLIPLFPLLGAAFNGILGGRKGKRTVGLIGCATVGLSFLLSLYVLQQLVFLPTEERYVVIGLFDWLLSGRFQVQVNFLIDPLSTLMILVVTGVGFLIHIYSIGYMHGERGYSRYFSYLNLFIFFMLMLVLGNNYIILFLGWEGVGLCSYLLIGFWYEKKSASDAGKKAFVVNRVGDFGFILGLFLLFWSLADHGVYSFNYGEVFQNIQTLSPGILTAVTCLLFVGAIGKSAQFPLYVWLPDAMEGPTPVSALIHAATMVTAGVYMIARNSALYSIAPYTGEIVASVGIFTALFAATIGLVQNDIKKVLAYSTVSQLGYMFAAVGAGAYAAGIFHLMTHAFFKGLLFLCSGSVIHAMAGEQDMRKMGGLHPYMKITSYTFIIGALAISGVPPFSGFWSKDEILWESFRGGHYIIWFVGLFTAFLTAFYMFRQIFMTFTGECRADEETRHHLHESPGVMTIPLLLLAVMAIIGGLVGIPFEGGSTLHRYLGPVFEHGAHAVHYASHSATADSGNLEFMLMGVSIFAGLSGIFLAALLYYDPLKKFSPSFWSVDVLHKRFHDYYVILYNKYYVDEIYEAAIIKPIKRGAQIFLTFDLSIIDGIVNRAAWITRVLAWLSHKFDIYIIDGCINSASTLVSVNSTSWRQLQTGYLQNYAVVIVLGLLTVIGWLFLI